MYKHIATVAGISLSVLFVVVFFAGRAETRHLTEVAPRVGMNTQPLSVALASLRRIRRMMRDGYDFDIIDAHYGYPFVEGTKDWGSVPTGGPANECMGVAPARACTPPVFDYGHDNGNNCIMRSASFMVPLQSLHFPRFPLSLRFAGLLLAILH